MAVLDFGVLFGLLTIEVILAMKIGMLMLLTAVHWWLRSCYSSSRYNEWNTSSPAVDETYINNWKATCFCLTIHDGTASQFLPGDYTYFLLGGILVVKIML